MLLPKTQMLQYPVIKMKRHTKKGGVWWLADASIEEMTFQLGLKGLARVQEIGKGEVCYRG